MLIFPMVSADVIIPGQSPIDIDNIITNIEDFPDYVFITVGSLMGENHLGMCPPRLIENGEIQGGYKFCELSVYAIKKTDYDPSMINELVELEDYKEYINSYGKLVIKNIEHYREEPDTNPIRHITNHYEIDLNKVLEEPNKKEIEKNYLFYLYTIIPIIALLIIIWILIKKYKK